MVDSILISLRPQLGIDETETAFDSQLVPLINSVFMVLWQIGIGPSTPFSITGTSETWSSFIGTKANIEGVKTYVALRVRLLFDPPTSSSVSEAFKRTIDELEWRLGATTSTAQNNLL